jgi:hypothetical protein
MQSHYCKVLLFATALILASSAAEARYWRHYGYHWYGRSWNDSRPNDDERQVEQQKLGKEPTNDPRNQLGFFVGAVEEVSQTCDRQVVELKNMPLDTVSRVVNPTPEQNEALGHIRSVARDASETLAVTCPKNTSGNIHERLDSLSRAFDAMAASLATLQPAFGAFYGLLNDEQKARLVAMTLPNQDEKRGSSNDNFYCQQWVTYLKKWPIRQIEGRGSLSDDQLATLYELTATIYRAAGKLRSVCNLDERLTPPGRLDARAEQLKALRESVDAISPALAVFENQLTDAQKAQLQGVLNLSNQSERRSVSQ